MRGTILDLLRSRQGQFTSGEEIANQLGVSRTAIWKHIKELKLAGYEIESYARSGYQLVGTPDRLLPELVGHQLGTQFLGKNLIHYDMVESTNEIAKKLARQGAEHGTVVVSEEQSVGKGRMDRQFCCPKGGIWFSVILRPTILPQEAPKCTLLAAVAVAKTMAKFGLEAGIKWPNDILYQGKKLTGILTEMSAEIDKINYVVIGTGINVNIPQEVFPAEIQDKAGSMLSILGEPVDRLSFFQEVLRNLEELYLKVMEEGFADLLQQWRQYSITLGQEIEVIGLDERYTGRAKDIDVDGALLVETATGIRKVLAGDVSIRPHK